MARIEKGDFDKKGLMKVLLPERFFTPKDDGDTLICFERVPISTHHGDFDALMIGFYSKDEGDLAYQSLFRSVSQFVGELIYAQSKGIDNSIAITVALGLLDTLSKSVAESQSFEHFLVGSAHKEDVELSPAGEPEVLIPIAKPEGIDSQTVGGAMQIRDLKPNSFNFAVLTLCSHRSNTSNLINGFFNTSALFRNQPASTIKQMSGDVTRAKLSMSF